MDEFPAEGLKQMRSVCVGQNELIQRDSALSQILLLLLLTVVGENEKMEVFSV